MVNVVIVVTTNPPIGKENKEPSSNLPRLPLNQIAPKPVCDKCEPIHLFKDSKLVTNGGNHSLGYHDFIGYFGVDEQDKCMICNSIYGLEQHYTTAKEKITECLCSCHRPTPKIVYNDNFVRSQISKTHWFSNDLISEGKSIIQRLKEKIK